MGKCVSYAPRCVTHHRDAWMLGIKVLYVGAALLVSGLTFLRLFLFVMRRRASGEAPASSLAT